LREQVFVLEWKLGCSLPWPTQITDAGVVHLRGLTKLQRLDLDYNKVTDTGVADLQKALPNCKIYK
jgi:hypothetical protein